VHTTLTELQARQEIQDRLARAAATRLRPRSHQRHQLADRLRRVADRLDS
jgi:hypothetical protein